MWSGTMSLWWVNANSQMAHCRFWSTILRLSSFRISALERSSRYPLGVVRVFDPLHSEAPDLTCLLNRLATTARERAMNGTVLIATQFHRFPPGWVLSEKEDGRFPMCPRTDRIL